MAETFIVVQFQFEGWHHWPGAVEPYKYLSHPHRHMFHVRAEKIVSHGDREIEIIELKARMKKWCEYQWGRIDGLKPKEYSTQSCEQMAERISKEFDVESCQVLEDGENGAIYYSLSAYTPNNKNIHPNFQSVKSERVSCNQPNEANRCTEIDYTNMEMKVAAYARRFPGKMFWGTEAEGPHRGIKTLFVPGDVDPAAMTSFIKTLPDREIWEHINIYFGADNCYFEWKTITHFIMRCGHLLLDKFSDVWIEHPIDSIGVTPNMLNNIFVVGMVTGYGRPASSEYDFAKRIGDNYIVWEQNTKHDDMITQTWRTLLNDPLFTQDKAV